MSTKVPDAAPGRSWREIFSKKKGAGTKRLRFSIRRRTGDHWSLDLRSTPKRAALRAPQGFRASREARDTIRCEE